VSEQELIGQRRRAYPLEQLPILSGERHACRVFFQCPVELELAGGERLDGVPIQAHQRVFLQREQALEFLQRFPRRLGLS